MDFDLQWLLIGLPVAFALGWVAARLDLRQWRRDAPSAYVRGLVLLLGDQQDQAVDTFIEAVQHDPAPASCTSHSAACSAAAVSTNARCVCTSTCWAAATSSPPTATALASRWPRTT